VEGNRKEMMMMDLKLTVNLDNAAFDEEHGGPGPELARIFRSLADSFEGGWCEPLEVAVMDESGNRVGTLEVEP
jgi:hypothetical protein